MGDIMQFLLNHWKTWSTILGVVPVLFVVIKFCIDNFNTLNVEKQFISNTKKVGIFISNGFLFSIPLFILFLILESFDKNRPIFDNDIERVLFCVAIFMSCFLSYLIMFIFLQFIFKFIKPKVKYYVELTVDDKSDSKKKWYIERKVGKDQIVLSNKIDRYKFHSETDIKKNEIRLDIQDLSTKQKSVYENINKYKVWYLLGLILFFIPLYIWALNTPKWFTAIILSVFLIIIVISVLLIIFVIPQILKELVKYTTFNGNNKDEDNN